MTGYREYPCQYVSPDHRSAISLSGRARLRELAAALLFLTRLPLAGVLPAPAAPGDAIWAYPVAGGVVGLIGAAVLALAGIAGMPPSVAAIGAVAATVWVSGALHEDGLADTADGFGGGRSAARKLEIIRDSRIGSYGALALMLTLALRVAALAALIPDGRGAGALVLACVLGRGAILGVLLALPPARRDGLSAALEPLALVPACAGIGIALAVALLMPGGGAALLAAGLATAAVTWLAWRQIGGQTGDVLGAGEQAAECAVLIACLIR